MKILISVLTIFCIYACSHKQKTIKIEPDDSKEVIIQKAVKVLPDDNQYAYKKLEFTCFIHFGVNTFTRKEWGNGNENPNIFKLQNLDTDQWCRTAKAAGMKLIMFTAKHHDGFCLWQTRYTKHGVMSSPFKDGKGDVLKELAASCKKYGLKLGIYLSPADLYQIENKDGLYGNLSTYTEREIPKKIEGRPYENKTTFKFLVDDYNEYFLNQLFELLTEYGPIHEVWFDGAHPKRKGGQTYNYHAWKKLIHTLAPEAVIFGKEDVRWCGNEAGQTRDTEWDVVAFAEDPNVASQFPDMHGDLGNREQLYKAKYLHFLPAETNTSIREGWFYRDELNQKVRSADDVFDIYERSVGGNSTFLLNIPPNREGLFSDEDVEVLEEVGKRIQSTYGVDLLAKAKGKRQLLDTDDDSYATIDEEESFVIELENPVKVNRFVLQEPIHITGQRVELHALDAWINKEWKQVAQTTNIGYKRILRFHEVTTSKFRIRIISSRARPYLSKVSAHYYSPRPPQLSITRSLEGMVNIEAMQHDFGWKAHGVDYSKNLNGGFVIHFTRDGSEPTLESPLYESPFFLQSGLVKSCAFSNGTRGSIKEVELGILKNKWRAKASHSGNNKSSLAIDANVETYWISNSSKPELVIDFGKQETIKGMKYTPPTSIQEGLLEKGKLLISNHY